MDSFKVEYKFNLNDFKKIEEIEHSYFPNDNITKAEEVMKWYEKNNLTCIGVKNFKDEVIASVNVLPLERETYYNIYDNKMNEADVTFNQIEEYKNDASYYIYLSSISIDNEYRNNYKIIIILIKGCIDLFELLLRRNIKIEKVMADASTIHGERICNKLLKMDYIHDTDHDSKIYCETGEKFVEAIDRIKKFIK